jgi:hypothetical protein
LGIAAGGDKRRAQRAPRTRDIISGWALASCF